MEEGQEEGIDGDGMKDANRGDKREERREGRRKYDWEKKQGGKEW